MGMAKKGKLDIIVPGVGDNERLMSLNQRPGLWASILSATFRVDSSSRMTAVCTKQCSVIQGLLENSLLATRYIPRFDDKMLVKHTIMKTCII
jgi:hypothetical protein